MRSTRKELLFVLSLVVLLWSCRNKNAHQLSEVAFTLQESQLPDYEKNIDHQAILSEMLSGTDKEFSKGQTIYNHYCFTCHGNPVQEGSIPKAFKYWKDHFKVGGDPYSMYQTITRGYGSMPPQVQLTPIEKYEVIHYIREEFVHKLNKDEYTTVDPIYLSGLPKGTLRGPAPGEKKPWAEMDYGNFLINTYELVPANAAPREISSGSAPLPDEHLTEANFAYKGIAVRVDEGPGGVAAGKAWMIFDHDLMRIAGAWTGKGFIDWEAILFNGEHNISPRTIGDLQVANPVVPGWADPKTGSFKDDRFMALDKRRFGPLRRTWTQYKGLYHFKDKVVITYSVGKAEVLEKLGLEGNVDEPVFTRTLNIGPSTTPLKMLVAPENASVSVVGDGVNLKKENGYYILEIPASKISMFKLLMAKGGMKGFAAISNVSAKPEDLTLYTKGGSAQYPQKLLTKIDRGEQDGVFQVDRMELPYQSPWKNQMRMSGIDFLDGGTKALVCATDGDVWMVDGLMDASGTLSWKRIASGLFQPLGIKVVEGKIYVTCRDQLVRLNDLNGDGEIDFYESFNSDHQVTNHFHEFAMGLQTDKEGNFYYAKSARHARRALVPQHGTLLKVSKDGQTTQIIAHGFRAANGVCINPDGSFFVTDQEGHWTPMNRINWIGPHGGGFYGNMFAYDPSKDSSDQGMEQPLMWIERDIDQSPSELLWVDSKAWGPLNGSLLSFSYGYGKVFVVPHEQVGGQMQGGVFELPIPRFSTGVMRGRFNPADGQLYACGLSAWGSTQPDLGGFYRIRYNGGRAVIPIGLNVKRQGIRITFTHPLQGNKWTDTSSFKVQTWDLKRVRKYGSDHYNAATLPVTQVDLSADSKEIFLTIPGIKPTWVMEIQYTYKDTNGKDAVGMIQNTINRIGD